MQRKKADVGAFAELGLEVDIEKEDLEKLSVVVKIYNYNNVRMNNLLGTVRLGHSQDTHWQEMMESRVMVRRWHCLS